MPTQPAPGEPSAKSFVLRMNSFAETTSAAVILIAITALVGWGLENTTLKSLAPGFASVKPNEAVAFILLGAALWILRREDVGASRRRLANGAAGLAFVIGALTLVEHTTGWNPGIDQLFFREAENSPWTSEPGRMAPSAAINFMLLGTALIRLDVPAGFRGIQLLALAAIFVSLLAHLAYVYALELLHGTGFYTHLSIQSTVAFCLLSGGVLFSRPQRGLMAIVASETAGGRVARALLPPAIIVPALLAWIPVVGEQGKLYGSTFGVTLLTVMTVVALTVLVLSSARSLHGADVERNRAHEAIRQSEERFRLLVEAAPDYSIIMLDPTGRVTTWNSGAERIKGYAAEEVLGRHFSQFYTPEDVSAARPAQTLEIASAEGRFEEEGWRRRKDGTRFRAHVVVTALRGSTGALRGFSKITRDVTERHQAEEQLREANAGLRDRERALRDAFLQLKQAHEELQVTQLQLIQAAKMESVGRLAAGVAHEVKNPLAIVQSGADFLLRQPGREPVERDVVEEIVAGARRADAIVRDLLDFSAPHELELESANLNAVVERALRLLKHDLERRRVRIELDLDPRLPEIRLDPAKIEQVLVNLLLNAAQSIDGDGLVTIRTYTAPGRMPTDRSSVVAEINDTGPGIPEAQLSKVFDPFFTTRAKGTGLGLAVSKTIIDLHGGRIDISNRPEGGASVRIVLDDERSDTDENAEAASARGRRGRLHEAPEAEPRGDGSVRGPDRERWKASPGSGAGVSTRSGRS